MDDDVVAFPEPERFLRLGKVLDRTGLSRATLYRKIADGSFPKQIKISERCAAGRESDVRQWVFDRFAESLSAS